MGSEWYVLIDTQEAFGEEHWHLRDKIHVEGGREQALARAEELCFSYLQQHRPLDEHGHAVYRTSDTSWLVEVSREAWHAGWERPSTCTSYARLTVAELVAVKETPPATRKTPKKGLLRRALGGD